MNPFRALLKGIRRLWSAWQLSLTEVRIRQSLRADNPLLVYVAFGQPFRETNIPESAQYLCPELTVHASGFNQHVAAAKADLSLVLDVKESRRTLLRRPIELGPGPFELEGIAVRWAGTSLSALRGPACLRILVAEREMAQFPLMLLGNEDFARQIQVSRVRLNAVLQSGKSSENPTRLLHGSVKSLAPSFEVTCPTLSPATELPGHLVVAQGARPLFEAPLKIRLNQPRLQFRIKPVELEGVLQPEVPLVIRLEICRQPKLTQSVPVIGSQPVTTFDGSLVSPA